MVNKTVKTLYFDYDGTLHHSIKIYAPAFRKAYKYLVEKGVAPEKEWSDHAIGKWLGFNKEKMWLSFMPDLDPSIRNDAGSIIGHEMNRLTLSGEAELYKHTKEVLTYLKEKGYQLIFLSNCSNHYLKMHKEQFNLDQWFSAFYTAEAFNYMPKSEILTQIIKDHGNDAVMIGDRLMDIEAGLKNGLKTIGCSYGYGPAEELIQSTLLIENITDLYEIL